MTAKRIFCRWSNPNPSNNPWNSKIKFGVETISLMAIEPLFAYGMTSGLLRTLIHSINRGGSATAGLNEPLLDDRRWCDLRHRQRSKSSHDINNDAEADYYENFNNDIKITKILTSSHSVWKLMQLKFLHAKAAPVRKGRGFDVTHDNHGVTRLVRMVKTQRSLQVACAPGRPSVEGSCNNWRKWRYMCQPVKSTTQKVILLVSFTQVMKRT